MISVVHIKLLECGERPAAARESGSKRLHPLVANTVFIEIEAGERRQRPGAEAAAAKDVLAQPWRNHRTKVTDVLECTYHGIESHGSENDREAKAVEEGRQMRGHRRRGPCGGSTMKQDAKKLGNQEARRKMQSRKDARKQRRFKTQRKQRSYTQEAKK